MEKIYAAILGLGTVGQGVAMMMINGKDTLYRRAGSEIILKRTLERHPDRVLDIDLEKHGVIRSSNWEDILDDPDISIVVETIGGVEPAKTYILDALSHGKNVVTANKELLALHWVELFEKAQEAGMDLYFEASVAGAVPVISALRQNLSGVNIHKVTGIVNGSTNYMLTRMKNEGLGYADVLDDAKALGYLEADPTADVEGLDAARKTAILATLCFRSQVGYDEVYKEGITNITSEDMKFAAELGYTIKLLAICHQTEEGIEARVSPCLIPLNHPLAKVEDSFNGVFIEGEGIENVMLYGRGAGRMPTASAVMGDVVEIVRNINFNCTGRLNQRLVKNQEVVPIEKVVTRFFLRLILEDKPGTMAAITKTLAKYGVSMDTILQKDLDNSCAEVVVVTHPVVTEDMTKAIEEIRTLNATREIKTILRVEGLE